MNPIVRLTRLVDTPIEPISLASAKVWLKVENSVDDDLIGEMITASRLVIESTLSRSLMTTTWRYAIDQAAWSGRTGIEQGLGYASGTVLFEGAAFGWPRPAIRLPMAPVIAVTAVDYVLFDGSTAPVALDSTQALDGTPGYVALPPAPAWFGSGWPTNTGVRVTFTAGYGSDPASVPRNLVLAMRLLIAHYYTHRSTQAEIPDAVASLLSPSSWVGHA